MRRERIRSGSIYHTIQHMRHHTLLSSWLYQGLKENLWARMLMTKYFFCMFSMPCYTLHIVHVKTIATRALGTGGGGGDPRHSKGEINDENFYYINLREFFKETDTKSYRHVTR